MKTVIPILLVVVLMFFSSCMRNYSVIATGYDPVLIEKKGDIQTEVAYRPFRIIKLSTTAGLSKHLGVRTGYTAQAGLKNMDLSLILHKELGLAGLYLAGLYEYQENKVNGNFGSWLFENGGWYSYNCVYHSPGIIIGAGIKSSEKVRHQIFLKTSLNIVEKYNYRYLQDNRSGKSDGYYIKDDEDLNYIIPDFLSVGFNYHLLCRMSRFLLFKFTFGYNYCQQVYRHTYTFSNQSYGGPDLIDAAKMHPSTYPMYFSLGLVFKKDN